MFRKLALALLVVLGGCDSSPSGLVFETLLVDSDRGNPAAGTDIDTLNITLQQGTSDPGIFAFPVVDGAFDVGIQIVSITALTQMRVEFLGPTTELIGAPPAFSPVEIPNVLSVVVGEPSTCGRVSGMDMAVGRAFFGAALSNTFAFVAGGSSEDPQVESLDLLALRTSEFPGASFQNPLGQTKVANVDDTQVLVISAGADPFIFDLANPDERVIPVVSLHAGAGLDSALVSVPGIGAYVLGGGGSSTPTDALSLVEPDGDVTPGSLGTARSGAAAVAVGGSVLVVGGDALGTAEIVNSPSSITSIPIFEDSVREASILVASATGEEALLMGGLDAGSGLRDDTVLFLACPGLCIPDAGPTWAEAREGAINPSATSFVVGGNASTLIEEVVFTSTTADITTANQLEFPRSDAAGVALSSGILIVVGGTDGVSTRSDVEYCFPSQLTEL